MVGGLIKWSKLSTLVVSSLAVGYLMAGGSPLSQTKQLRLKIKTHVKPPKSRSKPAKSKIQEKVDKLDKPKKGLKKNKKAKKGKAD